MIAATAGTRCAPLVRVPKRDEAPVKLALDLGAEGIMFPLVGNAGEAAECVALTRYPPRGRRGWGPFVAHARWGVFVASTKDGRVLSSRDGDRLFTPASNMKIFTTAVALDVLGADYRWRTSVYSVRPMDANGVVDGDLTLYGRGAPDFDSKAKGGLPALVDHFTNAGLRRCAAVIGTRAIFAMRYAVGGSG